MSAWNPNDLGQQTGDLLSPEQKLERFKQQTRLKIKSENQQMTRDFLLGKISSQEFMRGPTIVQKLPKWEKE